MSSSAATGEQDRPIARVAQSYSRAQSVELVKVVAMDDDAELREMVKKTLEGKGVLAQLRVRGGSSHSERSQCPPRFKSV